MSTPPPPSSPPPPPFPPALPSLTLSTSAKRKSAFKQYNLDILKEPMITKRSNPQISIKNMWTHVGYVRMYEIPNIPEVIYMGIIWAT
ncbi:hypothetical protein RhiirC2_798754 [Rhizophagus irregularis]|uniref:Uncharacterized protein n=1 Tax=Rhizophagus irregularis TaxID=588596 RepID=A0A2N1M5Z1_9GLOM|nr:hypothetical protein RhiirC2_798754 [Rhizophagus irregularis]